MFKNLFKQDEPQQPTTAIAQLLLNNANQIKQKALQKKQKEQNEDAEKEKGKLNTTKFLSSYLDLEKLEAKLNPFSNSKEYIVRVYKDLLKFDLVLPKCAFTYCGNETHYLFVEIRVENSIEIEYSNVHYFLELDYNLRPEWKLTKKIEPAQLEDEVNLIVDQFIDLINAVKTTA